MGSLHHWLAFLASFLVSATRVSASVEERALAEALMAGFQTTTDVTDYARIDLDQQYINRQVELATQDDFEAAKSVYEMGAFSKSIASLTLTESIGTSLSAGANIAGRSESGAAVNAIAAKNIQASDTVIQAQYLLEGCNVGGLATTSPVIDGCFASEASLNIEGTTVQYTGYTPTTDTSNGRSIQSFSTDAESTMQHPGSDTGTFYPDFEKFVLYYGSTSYADDIVQAAFLGRPTGLKNGNIDFSLFDYAGRAEAVKTATAYMATAIKIVAELESSLYACLGCNLDDCRIDALGYLDRAVALYTGSLEGASGTIGEGTGLYSLAELRGKDFLTAPTGKSNVNINIMAELTRMKSALGDGSCAGARSSKLVIAQQIFVPMIQSTIRWTWILNETNADEAAEVGAMAFAASVLPVVYSCAASDAETIYSQLQDASPDFQMVKIAFETTYACMGITCADVGGYWDDGTQNYHPGAEPCSGTSRLLVGGLTVMGTLLVGLALFF